MVRMISRLVLLSLLLTLLAALIACKKKEESTAAKQGRVSATDSVIECYCHEG